MRKYVLGGIIMAMRVMAKKAGITLEIGGDIAATNGKKIILPDLPPDDEVAMVKARGYLDHESAHIALTDFSIPNNQWQNILEDVRIELLHAKTYPGMKHNTNELMQQLVKEGSFTVAKPQKDLLGLLMMWTLARLRHRVLGQTALAIREQLYGPMVIKAFGKQLADALIEITNKVVDCASTRDCQLLVEEIEKLLNEWTPPPESQPKGKGKSDDSDDSDESQPQGKGKSDDSDDSDESQPKGKGKSDDSDDSDESQPKGKGKSDDSNDSDETQPQGKGKGARARAKINTKTQVETDLGSILKRKLGEFSSSMGYDELIPIPQDSPIVGTTTKGIDSLNTALRKNAVLSSQLKSLLQAQRLKKNGNAMCGTKISNHSIHLIACKTPDTRVFKARNVTNDINTAIALLIDKSGSMVSDIDVAAESAYVVAKAVSDIPETQITVGAFPHGLYENEIGVVKKFQEKPNPKLFMGLRADAGTPLAEALLWGGQQVSLRPEPRKMVMVFTDGEPNSISQACRACEILKERGIEIYFVVLGSIFPWILDENLPARSINGIEDLGPAIITLLRESLVHKHKR